MKRLAATLPVQQAEAAKLEAAIAANLRKLRYGGHERAARVEGLLRIDDRMNTPLQENIHYLEISPPAVAKLFPSLIMPLAAAQIRPAAKVTQPVSQIRSASKVRPPIALLYGVAAICQEHGRLLAEYRFAGIDKPIGISTYELTRALPRELRSALPTVEEIEAEFSGKRLRPRAGKAGEAKVRRKKS